jgi:hypothetical protein
MAKISAAGVAIKGIQTCVPKKTCKNMGGMHSFASDEVGGRMRQARNAYERFVAEGVDLGRRPALVGGRLIRSAGGWSAIKALRVLDMRIMGDERILGSGDFVQSVLDHAQEQYEKKTWGRRESSARCAQLHGDQVVFCCWPRLRQKINSDHFQNGLVDPLHHFRFQIGNGAGGDSPVVDGTDLVDEQLGIPG